MSTGAAVVDVSAEGSRVLGNFEMLGCLRVEERSPAILQEVASNPLAQTCTNHRVQGTGYRVQGGSTSRPPKHLQGNTN